ncbi:hypothetical protein SAMD00019534_118980 [Acytostelium subglobosum LB1]|uniref:hypothetical protein n=1 Tax=Acytostelium subglobosum LB1 TaxID=1410327 RepID=UPI000644E816|nr:hypothetical protein SAMD00019534_118980 [Acytostelium subglobosum LB1]GAM28722.1 hypothetical protein SAMD00019534_118980 [Acytostelium subglobosum LB1]|eukprot:XP_012748277.1 hypothetical protein SAMD00019534_118980 [Acytostelium subglobosum LB1]
MAIYFNPRPNFSSTPTYSSASENGATTATIQTSGQLARLPGGSPQWPSRQFGGGLPNQLGGYYQHQISNEALYQQQQHHQHQQQQQQQQHQHEASPSISDGLAHSNERLPHFVFSQSPSFMGMTSPFQNVLEGNLKIDLYHKPRGSKGTWVPIGANDQIRVTEGKGKRIKMIVHGEQELVKVGLQVGLLDLQSSGAKKSTNPGSPPTPGSSINNNTNSASTAPSPSTSSNGPSAMTGSSPSTHPNSSIQPSSITQSPSSFSLSSPSQSPSQSPLFSPSATTASLYSVSISVTPPSQNPAPELPAGNSTQLPAPDPQGLSVESVRVYRYPSMSQITMSALEFELKLARLSKKICIVISAQARDGGIYEARSVDFYAHNNGKHNNNSLSRQNSARKTPYSSPTMSGNSQDGVPTSPAGSDKKKYVRSMSSSALLSNNNNNKQRGASPPIPALPPIPLPATIDFSAGIPAPWNFGNHQSIGNSDGNGWGQQHAMYLSHPNLSSYVDDKH